MEKDGDNVMVSIRFSSHSQITGCNNLFFFFFFLRFQGVNLKNKTKHSRHRKNYFSSHSFLSFSFLPLLFCH